MKIGVFENMTFFESTNFQFIFFSFIPLEISHTLWGSMDGTPGKLGVRKHLLHSVHSFVLSTFDIAKMLLSIYMKVPS